MKKSIAVKSLFVLMLFGFFALSVNAQRKYKQPRVKIKTEKINYSTSTKTHKPLENETVTTIPTANEEHYVPSVDESVTVASASGETSVVSETVVKKRTRKQHASAESGKPKKKTLHIGSFMEKVKSSEAGGVKDVQKTSLSTMILVAIILYALGLIFLILAIVFFFSIIGLIFWILMGLCFVAATILLLLSLLGVV